MSDDASILILSLFDLIHQESTRSIADPKQEDKHTTMPKSSIAAVALVAFLAGALSPSADAFVPRQMSVARSATCESVFCFRQFEFLHGPAAFLECSSESEKPHRHLCSQYYCSCFEDVLVCCARHLFGKEAMEWKRPWPSGHFFARHAQLAKKEMMATILHKF